MAESSTKRMACFDKKDIISELPSNIHEVILDFLPIRDAVRTSILSRTWRYRWTTIPNLVFDYHFLRIMRNKLSHYDNPKLKAYEFVSIVNKVLLLHSGPIRKFNLGVLKGCDIKIIIDYINQWIPLLSRKSVKRLTLEIPMYDTCNYFFNARSLSCLELTDLRLSCVDFRSTPAFGGFAYLTSLELFRATADKGSIFNCPVLEKLTLVSCSVFHTNFCAPNLKYLHIISRLIPLEGLKNITEFSVNLANHHSMQMDISPLVKVVGCLRNIKQFSIGKYFFQFLAAGGSPNRLPEPLHYLKNLHVSGVNFGNLSEISCLLCLIRSAPKLYKLGISASRSDSAAKDTLKDHDIKDSVDCTLNQLEIVTFSYFKGCTVELELIKFLLSHSPVLNMMFIHRNKNVQQDVVATMVEEMMQFSRVSPRAEIRHMWKPDEIVDMACTYKTLALHHNM